MGESIADLSVEPRGAAIECRINAEDPGRNFLPGPGRITRYSEPAGPFVRVDAGVGPGREIPGDYDSMFAKLVVFGSDREQARRRMLRALDEYIVEGRAHDDPGAPMDARVQGVQDRRVTPPRGPSGPSPTPSLPAQAELAPPGPSTREGRAADILVEVDGPPGAGARVRRAPRRGPAGRPRRTTAEHQEHVHGEVRAEMQGTIIKVLVEKGQDIRAGEVICILEAMKMENHVAATRDGEVTDLPIRAGQVVETGQVLAVID